MITNYLLFRVFFKDAKLYRVVVTIVAVIILKALHPRHALYPGSLIGDVREGVHGSSEAKLSVRYYSDLFP